MRYPGGRGTQRVPRGYPGVPRGYPGDTHGCYPRDTNGCYPLLPAGDPYLPTQTPSPSLPPSTPKRSAADAAEHARSQLQHEAQRASAAEGALASERAQFLEKQADLEGAKRASLERVTLLLREEVERKRHYEEEMAESNKNIQARGE